MNELRLNSRACCEDLDVEASFAAECLVMFRRLIPRPVATYRISQICANSHSLAVPLPDYRFWIDLHNSRSGGDDDSGPLTGNEREGWHNWGWRNWVESAGLQRARYAYGCGHRARLHEIRGRAEGRSARLPPCGLARSKSSAA